MAERLIPLTKSDIDYLCKLENITPEQCKDYFLKNGSGTYFIKRSGLLYKLEKKHGAVSIITEVPSESELAVIRKMLGISDSNDKPFVVMKSTVVINEAGLQYTDYGTATAQNTNSSTRSYLVEMASTRGSNRAIRMAVACAYTSDTELNIEAEPAEIVPEKVTKEVKETPKTRSRKTATKKEEPNAPTKEEMLKSIKSLQEDYGYSDVQLTKSLSRLFSDDSITLDKLSIDQLKTVYEKMIKLKAA